MNPSITELYTLLTPGTALRSHFFWTHFINYSAYSCTAFTHGGSSEPLPFSSPHKLGPSCTAGQRHRRQSQPSRAGAPRSPARSAGGAWRCRRRGPSPGRSPRPSSCWRGWRGGRACGRGCACSSACPSACPGWRRRGRPPRTWCWCWPTTWAGATWAGTAPPSARRGWTRWGRAACGWSGTTRSRSAPPPAASSSAAATR